MKAKVYWIKSYSEEAAGYITHGYARSQFLEVVEMLKENGTDYKTWTTTEYGDEEY